MRCSGYSRRERGFSLLGCNIFLLCPQLLPAGTIPAGPTNLRFASPAPQPGGKPLITPVAGALRDENEIMISETGFGSHDGYGGGRPYLCAAWTKFKGWTNFVPWERAAILNSMTARPQSYRGPAEQLPDPIPIGPIP